MRCIAAMIIWVALISSCRQEGPVIAPRAAQQPAPAARSATAPTFVQSTPTATPAAGDVRNLLQRRPAPGVDVEIDAYFSGGWQAFSLGGPPPDQIPCPPAPWNTALTDQPFPGTLTVLNGASNNTLPPDAPFLVATVPEALRIGSGAMPDLPFHARLRGHLDDPQQAHCPGADRIFVVEQVVTVYAQNPPPDLDPQQSLADYPSWSRYTYAAEGYSVTHPPDWTIETNVDPRFRSSVALRSTRWPQSPVMMRVRDGETPITGYVAADPPPLHDFGLAPYQQGGVYNDVITATQRLAAFDGDRDVGNGQREIVTLFNANGRTYELTLRYPIGFAAAPRLLAIYTGIVESFRLDQPPT